MAEAVILAVSKIGSVLVEEAAKAVITKLSEKAKNLKELPEKIEEIKSELKSMNNVIKQKSTAHLTNDAVKGRIAEVRELAYRVQDVMDKYSYHALKHEEERTVKMLFNKAHYVRIFSEIAEEIIQIERKIEKVVRRKDRWLLPSQLDSNPLADIERRRSQDRLPDTVQDDLVGIEDNRRLLTEWLYSNEPSSRVITVCGMGGLGKTSLVTDVYERDQNIFTAHAWITVSQSYDVAELLRKLLRKIGQEQTQLAELDAIDLREKIKKKLKYGKCLIVLDDVWDREAYTQIGDALPKLEVCRIIITTRQEQVAALAHQSRQLRLKLLEHRDAFDLLCRKAFFNSMDCKCPPEVEKLANDIVDRCQGLPLAIVTIGGMLSSLPPISHVWNETYQQLLGELKNNNDFQAILNLSYHDLPGDLRNCFLYCSLFPEDHRFSQDSLVRLWVAEGFVVGKEQKTPEEVAERYLRELIQRNMLEAMENDELGRVSICKMHDIMRHLAISIAEEEKFAFANDFRTMV